MNKMLLFVLLGLVSFLMGHCTHEMFVQGVTSEVQIKFDDVKPVFKQRCFMCHRPGGIPGNWTDYDQAFEKKSIIFSRVKNKNMPPGNATGMTSEEREKVLTWIKQGARR